MSTKASVDLVPVKKESDSESSPGPSPGGEYGISGPWDMDAPVETREEYAQRIRKEPEHHPKAIEDSRKDIKKAEKRGDKGFARLRTEDTRDKLQGTASHGDLYTWLILGGGCAIFLLLTLLLILLPYGRDANMPHILLY